MGPTTAATVTNGNGKSFLISVVTASVAVLGLVGSMLWFVASVYTQVQANERGLSDWERVIDSFIAEQRQWNTEERSYDAEVRNRVNDMDKARQDAYRALWERLAKCADRQ